MINQIRLLLLTALTVLLPISQANAVEALSAKELALHCKEYPEDSSSLDGEFCARYIQGFIDGAVATDARVMLNVEADLDRKETFSERATRIRSPSREEYLRAARYAEYCLGDPVPLKEVVNHIVNALDQMGDIDELTSAREVVYASLVENYPCQPK